MAQSTSPLQVVPSPEDIRRLLRSKVLTAIHEVLYEELEAVLGSGRYERTQGRRGYRHGSERRRITTEVGPVELEVPRGRIVQPDGTTAEVQSTILPCYQRRTQRVNEALLGAYLAGANTRRIRRALGSSPRFLDSLLRCDRKREGGQDEAQAVQPGTQGQGRGRGHPRAEDG